LFPVCRRTFSAPGIVYEFLIPLQRGRHSPPTILGFGKPRTRFFKVFRNTRDRCLLNLQTIKENLRFERVSIGSLQILSQLPDFGHQSLHAL